MLTTSSVTFEKERKKERSRSLFFLHSSFQLTTECLYLSTTSPFSPKVSDLRRRRRGERVGTNGAFLSSQKRRKNHF
jgi:hypothetical protein